LSVESWTLSQSYDYGSVSQNRLHCLAEISGTCIGLADQLDEGAICKPGKAKPNGSAKGQRPRAAAVRRSA
jgi:hypothetical protein